MQQITDFKYVIHKLFTKIFAKVVDRCYQGEYIINRVSTLTLQVLIGAKI